MQSKQEKIGVKCCNYVNALIKRHQLDQDEQLTLLGNLTSTYAITLLTHFPREAHSALLTNIVKSVMNEIPPTNVGEILEKKCEKNNEKN